MVLIFVDICWHDSCRACVSTNMSASNSTLHRNDIFKSSLHRFPTEPSQNIEIFPKGQKIVRNQQFGTLFQGSRQSQVKALQKYCFHLASFLWGQKLFRICNLQFETSMMVSGRSHAPSLRFMFPKDLQDGTWSAHLPPAKLQGSPTVHLSHRWTVQITSTADHKRRMFRTCARAFTRIKESLGRFGKQRVCVKTYT